jgi:hypothetical protein
MQRKRFIGNPFCFRAKIFRKIMKISFDLNVWRFIFIVSEQISNICSNPQQRHLSNIRAIVVPEERFEQNNRHITTDKSHWSLHKALKALQRDLSTR